MPDLRGLFLRGYGEQTHKQNNGTNVGETETVHASASLGSVQGDAFREMGTRGEFLLDCIENNMFYYGPWITSGVFNSEIAYDSGHLQNMFTALPSFGRALTVGYNHTNKVIFDMGNSLPTSNEIRPVNMAVRYLIRALP